MVTTTAAVISFLQNEKAFRAGHPFKLTPTNLKGAYAVPACPDAKGVLCRNVIRAQA